MITRTSDNWTTLPGYFDRHNLFEIFDSSNSYGIPDLNYQEITPPENLVPYNIRVRSELGYRGLGIHFFLDDYRFEQVWVKPEAGIERVRAAEVALTPDFSLFMDMPRAVQIYNTYRNRWVGRFWQQKGIKIIPTLSWSDEESFDFCFAGIPRNMTVAVSTVSTKTSEESKKAFLSGFEKAVKTIEPENIVCYGKPLQEMFDIYSYKNIKSYATFFSGLRNLRKAKPELEVNTRAKAC